LEEDLIVSVRFRRELGNERSKEAIVVLLLDVSKIAIIISH